jgi:hypothetical protein
MCGVYLNANGIRLVSNGPRHCVCGVSSGAGFVLAAASRVQARPGEWGHAGEEGELLGVLLLPAVGHI